MARHFFALWPSEDAAGSLGILAGDVAARTGGRAVPQDKIHLTLAFLGPLDDDRVAAATRIGERVQATAFSLRLQALGAFRRARVAWITDPAPEPGLLALQAGLEARLREARFALEARPFKPHVTLARRTQAHLATQAVAPIAWRATDFALVRSDGDSGRYISVATWALRG